MTPQESYYAVIFTSCRTNVDDGYDAMAKKMEALAKTQTGFLDIESAREAIGIWENLEAIAQWKKQTDHLFAQQKGIKDWYSWYKVRICLVQREYLFEK